MTRGGKLTILNGLLWVVVALGIATEMPVLIIPAVVVCWPIAWLFILPVFGRVTPAGEREVMACVWIGINSFLWGYGISWLVSLLQKPKGVVPPA